MIAAVLAMVCSAFGLTLIQQQLGHPTRKTWWRPMPWRLALALATSAASARGRHARGAARGGRWDELLTREVAVGPLAIRPRGARGTVAEAAPVPAGEGAGLADDARGLAGLVAARGDRVRVALRSASWSGSGPTGLVVLLNEVLMVVAGVSVFGAENRGKTHRFLAHHGARPGVVWAVKVAVWAAWLVAPGSCSAAFGDRGRAEPAPAGRTRPCRCLITMTGARGGPALRDGDPAGDHGGAGRGGRGVRGGHPAGGARRWQMLPWVVPLLVPLALLVVSWAWSADWMLERPGRRGGGGSRLLLAVRVRAGVRGPRRDPGLRASPTSAPASTSRRSSGPRRWTTRTTPPTFTARPSGRTATRRRAEPRRRTESGEADR